jgi:hypothetical protein
MIAVNRPCSMSTSTGRRAWTAVLPRPYTLDRERALTAAGTGADSVDVAVGALGDVIVVVIEVAPGSSAASDSWCALTVPKRDRRETPRGMICITAMVRRGRKC